MFIDRVLLTIKAGDGGDGITSFLHFKGVVNGGPDGGDGGRGGDVTFVGDRHVNSLADYYYKNKFAAENGERGGPKNCFGKDGKTLFLKVPLGTVIKDEESGNVIADIFEDGQKKTVLVGGGGGKGNARFVTSRRHAPHFSQTGEKTQPRKVILELKTFADVGLVGFPNVGKSTLLSKMTKARPKIANYHFTTLSPNLGVCECYGEKFVVADIPGLIEGAADGAGLGIEFLRHIERTRMLVHVVDVSGVEGRDPYEDFLAINAELKNYSPALAKLKQIVALNKCDIFGAEEKIKEFKEKIGRKYKTVNISAVSGEGVDALKAEVKKALDKLPPVQPLEFEPFEYAKPERLEYEIYRDEDGAFVVTGTLVDVLARNVVLTDANSMAYMHKVLKDRGIFKKLREMGAENGATIVIGGTEFEFME
ncbi:MAG: GTPase ObgE [Eubacteriales bacterium]